MSSNALSRRPTEDARSSFPLSLTVGVMVMRIAVEPAISTGKNHSPIAGHCQKCRLLLKPNLPGDQLLPIDLAWVRSAVAIRDYDRIKGARGVCAPVALSNYLNTKTDWQDRVHCKNYHVATARGLVVLTARCGAQKGYNPSLFYRALKHFSNKKSQNVCDCFLGSL
jgi:hypothetical protein